MTEYAHYGPAELSPLTRLRRGFRNWAKTKNWYFWGNTLFLIGSLLYEVQAFMCVSWVSDIPAVPCTVINLGASILYIFDALAYMLALYVDTWLAADEAKKAFRVTIDPLDVPEEMLAQSVELLDTAAANTSVEAAAAAAAAHESKRKRAALQEAVADSDDEGDDDDDDDDTDELDGLARAGRHDDDWEMVVDEAGMSEDELIEYRSHLPKWIPTFLDEMNHTLIGNAMFLCASVGYFVDACLTFWDPKEVSLSSAVDISSAAIFLVNSMVNLLAYWKNHIGTKDTSRQRYMFRFNDILRVDWCGWGDWLFFFGSIIYLVNPFIQDYALPYNLMNLAAATLFIFDSLCYFMFDWAEEKLDAQAEGEEEEGKEDKEDEGQARMHIETMRLSEEEEEERERQRERLRERRKLTKNRDSYQPVSLTDYANATEEGKKKIEESFSVDKPP